MLALFAVQSLPVWRHAGFGFLSGTEWFFRAGRFGILPMLYGTAAVSGVALLAAAPLGIGTAVFTAELLPRRARLAVKTAIELLAGIPSVVYGLLGVLLLRDFVLRLLAPWDPLSGDTLLTGGLLLGVMVLPTIASLADDALTGVPAGQRLAARALGLTRAEAVLRVSLPQALPGVVSAVLLGLGRALGETIAVFLVIGRQDNQWPERLLSLRPLAGAGQTLTTKLGGSETFLAWGDPLHWGAITGLALALYGLVAAVSLAGAWLSLPGERRA
jgi:phosphate transport system permease protein